MVEIRICGEQDIAVVMEFIHHHWAKDHVLSTHRSLMDWQHADESRPGRYNWLIGVDEEGIQGVLGFIPTWKFDAALKAQPVIWLALWKVIPGVKNHSLGLRLMNTLVQMDPSAVVAVQGINPKHPPMYKALGYRTGELGQYFLCNPEKSATLILAPAGFVLPQPRAGRAVLKEMNVADLIGLELDSDVTRLPPKTPRYFANRYLIHPVYRYRVFLVQLEGRPAALLATRVAESGSAKALRIVDFLGDEKALAECGTAIGHLMRACECEHADFWQYGLSEENLEACGFRRVDFDGEVVVPNYFEPFMRKNAKIEFAVKGAKEQGLAIFRGDGDQDRPNKAAANATGDRL